MSNKIVEPDCPITNTIQKKMKGMDYKDNFKVIWLQEVDEKQLYLSISCAGREEHVSTEHFLSKCTFNLLLLSHAQDCGLLTLLIIVRG